MGEWPPTETALALALVARSSMSSACHVLPPSPPLQSPACHLAEDHVPGTGSNLCGALMSDSNHAMELLRPCLGFHPLPTPNPDCCCVWGGTAQPRGPKPRPRLPTPDPDPKLKEYFMHCLAALPLPLAFFRLMGEVGAGKFAQTPSWRLACTVDARA